MARPRSEGPAAAWWPGLLILGAHLPDVSEWCLTLVGLQNERTHQFHTIKGAAALMLAGWAGLMLLARVRRARPLLLWAAAVWSHLLLDSPSLGHWIRSWYRDPPFGTDIPARGLDPAAELWFFGLFVVLTGLALALLHNRPAAAEPHSRTDAMDMLSAAHEYGHGERGQAGLLRFRVCAVWIPLVLIAFCLPGLRWPWMLAYTCGVVIALWGTQVEVKSRWLFNLVPLAPVIALGAVELWAGILLQRAGQLEWARDYQGAAALYRRSAALPTRSDKAIRWWGVGRCCENAGDFAGAEAAYRACVETDLEWRWSKVILAKLYLRSGTPAGRQAADRLLREVLDGDEPPYAKQSARWLLDNLGGKSPDG